MSDHLMVCVISTIRPDLLKLTLESFKRNVLRQYRSIEVIANLDPLYRSTAQDRAACKSMLRELSSVDPVFIEPNEPNFNLAVRSTWEVAVARSSPLQQYFLHLEDDWFLIQRVEKSTVTKAFNGQSTESFRLYLKNTSRNVVNAGFSLNPSFIKTSFAKHALSKWADDEDPEKFLRSLSPVTRLYTPKLKWIPTVADTGTYWRKKRGIHKTYVEEEGKLISKWNQSWSVKNLLHTLRYYVKYLTLKTILLFSPRG